MQAQAQTLPQLVFYPQQPSYYSVARTEAGERAQISRGTPGVLLLMSLVLAIFPTNVAFIGCSFIAGLVALRALYLLIFRTNNFRFTWLLATGLLLGYGLGAFNTALQVSLAGWTVSRAIGRGQEPLSYALAVCLAVSAELYWLGALIESPVRLRRLTPQGSGRLLIFVSLAITGIAYATGAFGYMGSHNADGVHQSALSLFPSIAVPILPAFTIMVFGKPKSFNRGVYVCSLLAVEFLMLVPQGRREMIYGAVVFFIGMTLIGFRFRLTSPRTMALLLTAGLALYIGNKVFFGMRYQRNQAGRRSSIGLVENLKGGSSVLTSGDANYDSQLSKNLQTRTFVLTYFSDLLNASWTHEPLWGKALFFNFRLAVPSMLDPTKTEVLDIGGEEVLVNPEFGLKIRDESNSILTTAVSDFGIAGCFIYPLLLTSMTAGFFRIMARWLPPEIAAFVFFEICFSLVQAEYTTGAYFDLFRNLIVLSMATWLVHKSSQLIKKRTATPRPTLVRRGVQLAAPLILCSLLPHYSLLQARQPGKAFELGTYDSSCGKPAKNCRLAFQKAFEEIRKTGGGVLSLPAGVFTVEFPEVPNNVANAVPLKGGSLMLVPPNTKISGHLDSKGNPDTIIEWSASSVPLLIFANSSNSAIQDIHFRFTGSTPHNFPYGDVALLKALGFQATFPHASEMGGGSYELFSAIYMFDSEHCRFENLVFDSRTKDNDHAIGTAFTVKGKGLFVDPVLGGGGLTEPVVGNSFYKLSFNDFVMGMVVSGQEDAKFGDITADHRASTMDIAPGHVIYLTHDIVYMPPHEGPIDKFNKNIEIDNLAEGPDVYSSIHAGGTLAIKYVEGGLITNISSRHPVGLIQTLTESSDVVLRNLKWETDTKLCETDRQVCDNPIINSVITGSSPQSSVRNITFDAVSLKSTNEPIEVQFVGTHLVLKKITIECPPFFKKIQSNPSGVMNIKNASDVKLTEFHYEPVIKHWDVTREYNRPLVCWHPCKNIEGSAEIHWPKSVQVPPPGNRVNNPDYQDAKDPASNIHIDMKMTLDPQK